MNDEKWEQLVESLRDKFEVTDERTEEVQMHDHTVMHDIVEFDSKLGHFRIVRESKPLVLGKQEFYSHRAGDTARTEYTVSDTELSYKLKLYRESDFGEYVEVDARSFGL